MYGVLIDDEETIRALFYKLNCYNLYATTCLI